MCYCAILKVGKVSVMKHKTSAGLLLTLVSAVLMLSMIIGTFLFVPLSASAASTDMLVTICSLNLRASASDSATVLTVMPSGAQVKLLQDSTSKWTKVSYSAYTGYCSSAYLKPAIGSGVTMTGKTTSDVNLRTGRGTSYTSLTVIPAQTTLTVTDNSDEDWAGVTYSSKSGYVNKPYLTVLFKLPQSSQPSNTQPAAVSPATQAAVTPTNADATEPVTYKNPGYSSLPNWFEYSYTDSILGYDVQENNKLVLSKSSLNLSINATYSLVALTNNQTPACCVTYKSSNTSVAAVSQNGVVSARSQGKATITATNTVTQSTATCLVVVSSNVDPTIAVTTAPTTAPTVVPTQTVTQKPTQAPTQKPTQAPTQAPTVSAGTLSLSDSNVTMYYNNHYQLFADSNASVTWSTSDSSVATVSNGIVISKGIGTATITAKTSKKSATCTVNVVNATTDIGVSHRAASIPEGKTFLAASTISSASWTSSNTAVATVVNGYILGVSPGKAVITASVSGGNRTILVTVTEPDPIRFAYTSPNCATKNSDVTFVALTDSLRTAVKFNVTVGSKVKTVTATSKVADGKNYIWKGTLKFDTAGTYKVSAYSRYNGVWSTCDDGNTTAFVTSTTDKSTTACIQRRPSDELISFIAEYEGYLSSAYSDPLTGDPTLGYGKLVFTGDTFYNSLSKAEAYAYLVQAVNNDGYSSKVNSFFINNSVRFNQQQYDAIVSFVYNTGTGVLSYDDELVSALLDCSSGQAGTTTYYINGSSVRIRKGPGTTYDIIDELDYGTTLTILEKRNSEWYYVQLSNGTKGYVCTDYIASKTSSGALDLNYVKQQNLINKFCQYHHAGGCIYGLLYRRVDEMEIFFYNDYSRNYGTYEYPISFTCATNKSFHT